MRTLAEIRAAHPEPCARMSLAGPGVTVYDSLGHERLGSTTTVALGSRASYAEYETRDSLRQQLEASAIDEAALTYLRAR
jgi:hypothetical protein